VSCECCVLSGRGLCVQLINRTEESYRVWCVCDCEALIKRRPWPTRGCCDMGGGDIDVLSNYKLLRKYYSITVIEVGTAQS
jgi:hypothetical protein